MKLCDFGISGQLKGRTNGCWLQTLQGCEYVVLMGGVLVAEVVVMVVVVMVVSGMVDRGGNMQLCDFGISGQLVDSIARTMDAGFKPYMAVSMWC